MKNSLLVFGTKNFNNSLNEIKEHFKFSLIFVNGDSSFNDNISTIDAILIEHETCSNIRNLNLINSAHNKPILLIEKIGISTRCNYNEKITFPLTLFDFNNKIVNFITSKKFYQNSSVRIKEYIIDKNEKKLSKDNLFINVTEKEIQLIELLFNETKPLSKNILQKTIWKYSENVDTHTVETHIYRLRKKIINKFSDNKFIINVKAGYSI
jgi:hypothetical protein